MYTRWLMSEAFVAYCFAVLRQQYCQGTGFGKGRRRTIRGQHQLHSRWLADYRIENKKCNEQKTEVYHGRHIHEQSLDPGCAAFVFSCIGILSSAINNRLPDKIGISHVSINDFTIFRSTKNPRCVQQRGSYKHD